MKKLLMSGIVAALLALPTPGTAANFLSVCVSGCNAAGDEAPGGAAKSDKWFFGPSVGFDAFTRYQPTKEYRAGVIPGVGYGLKYRPGFWTYTPSIVALDIFAQASLVKATGSVGSDHFDVDLLPVVTLFDWISVGYGYRHQFATESGVKDSGGALFSIGIRKSISSF